MTHWNKRWKPRLNYVRLQLRWELNSRGMWRWHIEISAESLDLTMSGFNCDGLKSGEMRVFVCVRPKDYLACQIWNKTRSILSVRLHAIIWCLPSPPPPPPSLLPHPFATFPSRPQKHWFRSLRIIVPPSSAASSTGSCIAAWLCYTCELLALEERVIFSIFYFNVCSHQGDIRQTNKL